MPERSQRVVLVRHTLEPEALTALGARLCYAGGDVDRLLRTIEEKDQRAFVERVMAMGHESVLEHVSFTFLIEGVSRVLLAQLTRHRIASFSVQSQRYVSYAGGFGYIVPPAIRALGPDAEAEYHAQMAQMQAWYEGWQKRLGDAGEKSNEDARFVLPNACDTKMIVTMNARSLYNFFAHRCCNRAQWEIRAVADQMLALVSAVAPTLFSGAGPSCCRSGCREGKMSCGKPQEVRGHIAKLKQGGRA